MIVVSDAGRRIYLGSVGQLDCPNVREGQNPAGIRHVESVEVPYPFVHVDQLLADFIADVRRVTGDVTWPRR